MFAQAVALMTSVCEVTEVFPGFSCFSKQVPYNNLNKSSAVSYHVVFRHIIHKWSAI